MVGEWRRPPDCAPCRSRVISSTTCDWRGPVGITTLRSTIAAGIALAVLTLAGCQTIDYRQVQPGYEKQYAMSACEIGAMGTEQGMIAVGSQLYVSSMQFSNAMANEARKQDYMRNCMYLHGWQAYVVEPVKAGAPAVPPAPRQ